MKRPKEDRKWKALGVDRRWKLGICTGDGGVRVWIGDKELGEA